MEHKIYLPMVLNIQPSVGTYSVCSMKMKQLPPHGLHKREGALELCVGSTTSSSMSRGAWGGTLGITERTLFLGPPNRRAGTTAASALLRYMKALLCISSVRLVAQSCPTLCNPMDCSTPGLPVQHQTLESAHSHPLSLWCYPTISSSVVPFSSCLQSFSASGSFPMSLFFTSGGQSIGVSASVSVLPMNIQDRFPSGLSGMISLLSKGLSRVFSNTTVQKHQFFCAQLSL